MANEAVCIESPSKYARYSVSDIYTISKNTLLQLSAVDLYALASDAIAANQIFAGIATEEKTAGNGVTEISAALDGVWDMKNNATVTIPIGSLVCLSGTNILRKSIEADLPLGTVFGKALEDAGTSEVIRVRVGSLI